MQKQNNNIKHLNYSNYCDKMSFLISPTICVSLIAVLFSAETSARRRANFTHLATQHQSPTPTPTVPAVHRPHLSRASVTGRSFSSSAASPSSGGESALSHVQAFDQRYHFGPQGSPRGYNAMIQTEYSSPRSSEDERKRKNSEYELQIGDTNMTSSSAGAGAGISETSFFSEGNSSSSESAAKKPCTPRTRLESHSTSFLRKYESKSASSAPGPAPVMDVEVLTSGRGSDGTSGLLTNVHRSGSGMLRFDTNDSTSGPPDETEVRNFRQAMQEPVPCAPIQNMDTLTLSQAVQASRPSRGASSSNMQHMQSFYQSGALDAGTVTALVADVYHAGSTCGSSTGSSTTNITNNQDGAQLIYFIIF